MHTASGTEGSGVIVQEDRSTGDAQPRDAPAEEAAPKVDVAFDADITPEEMQMMQMMGIPFVSPRQHIAITRQTIGSLRQPC